jgi:predicted RNA polymerase sigma factor
VLIIEAVIDAATAWARRASCLTSTCWLMMGGRERAAEEIGALYRASDFDLVRIVTARPISVIEGRPV